MTTNRRVRRPSSGASLALGSSDPPVTTVDAPVRTEGERRSAWRRLGRVVLALAGVVGLFLAYYAMSRTQPMNADGASISLQAWDLLHGNVLLGGWITDVPFYTNELLVLAVAELFLGLDGNVVHLCAAFEYTLITVGVILLARGRARGWLAVARVGIALAVMVVPQHGIGISVLLLSPDHTGSTVFLLATLVLIDRALTREVTPRWLPYAVGGVLILGEMSDPLVFYVGAVPLVLICVIRLLRAGQWRPWRWRGVYARLILATIVSIVVTRLILYVFGLISGVYLQAVEGHLASPVGILKNLGIAAQCLAANFGGAFFDRDAGLDTVVGAVRLGLLVTTLAVVAVAAVRMFRRRATSESSLVDELLVAGVLINLAAFVFSTIPADVGSARQIAPVTFLGAALVGRVLGPRLAIRPARQSTMVGRTRGWRLALAAVLTLAVGGEFVTQAIAPPVPHENYLVARFLEQRNLTYGLGNYWAANNLTLQTGGRVHVIPVWGADGSISAFRWLSKPDWYDPAQHDARFVVVRTTLSEFGTEAGAVAQFGPPRERVQLSADEIVLIYDHNLLVGLPAWCPGKKPSMAECD